MLATVVGSDTDIMAVEESDECWVFCPYCIQPLGSIPEPNAQFDVPEKCRHCGEDPRRDAPIEMCPGEWGEEKKRRCGVCGEVVLEIATRCHKCRQHPRPGRTRFELVYPVVEELTARVQRVAFDCGKLNWSHTWADKLKAHSRHAIALGAVDTDLHVIDLRTWPPKFPELGISGVFEVGLSDRGYVAVQHFVTPDEKALELIDTEGRRQSIDLPACDSVRYFFANAQLWALPRNGDSGSRTSAAVTAFSSLVADAIVWESLRKSMLRPRVV